MRHRRSGSRFLFRPTGSCSGSGSGSGAGPGSDSACVPCPCPCPCPCSVARSRSRSLSLSPTATSASFRLIPSAERSSATVDVSTTCAISSRPTSSSPFSSASSRSRKRSPNGPRKYSRARSVPSGATNTQTRASPAAAASSALGSKRCLRHELRLHAPSQSSSSDSTAASAGLRSASPINTTTAWPRLRPSELAAPRLEPRHCARSDSDEERAQAPEARSGTFNERGSLPACELLEPRSRLRGIDAARVVRRAAAARLSRSAVRAPQLLQALRLTDERLFRELSAAAREVAPELALRRRRRRRAPAAAVRAKRARARPRRSPDSCATQLGVEPRARAKSPPRRAALAAWNSSAAPLRGERTAAHAARVRLLAAGSGTGCDGAAQRRVCRRPARHASRLPRAALAARTRPEPARSA